MSGVLVKAPREDETGFVCALDLDLKGDNALGMVFAILPGLGLLVLALRRRLHIYDMLKGEGLESNSF